VYSSKVTLSATQLCAASGELNPDENPPILAPVQVTRANATDGKVVNRITKNILSLFLRDFGCMTILHLT
jgi:hypothetical protein